MRGSGWIAGDLPGHLIIRSDSHKPLTRVRHADVLTLNPFAKTAYLQKADGTEENYKLGLNGDLAFLPKGTFGAKIPLMVSIAAKGKLDSEEMAKIIKKHPIKERFILIGHCSWFGDVWCAGPMGFCSDSTLWSQFIATGGANGLAFSLSEQIGGLNLASMSQGAKESQLFAMLAEALTARFPELRYQTVFIESQEPRHAAMLAVLRKALGPYHLNTMSKKKLSPPWKRFLEHLNANLLERSDAQLFDLRAAVELFSDIDWSLLMMQVNRHSQVIPPSLLKS